MSAEPLPAVGLALRFYGDQFDPAEISRRLGVEPTQQFKPGDPRTPDGRGNRHRSGWRLRVGPRETIYIDDLLREFRERVDVDAGAVKRLCEELEVEAVVVCEVSQASAEVFPALEFPDDFLAWLTMMGASLVVDAIL